MSATTTVVEGDVLKPETLERAFEGFDTAFYLIHSVGADEDFEHHDREGAKNLARAARRAGVKHIIYLGGLAHGDGLSPHLRSRHEVSVDALKSWTPMTVLGYRFLMQSQHEPDRVGSMQDGLALDTNAQSSPLGLSAR